MVTNVAGQVLMTFHQPIPKIVEVGGVQYVFTIHASVSAAWVQPEHVNQLLNYKGSHCASCGAKQQFYLSSEANHRQWAGISLR